MLYFIHYSIRPHILNPEMTSTMKRDSNFFAMNQGTEKEN